MASYSKELVLDNLQSLKKQIESIDKSTIDKSKVLEIMERVIDVVGDIDVAPNMNSVEVCNKAVAFLEMEQRNYDYLDPDDGGLYCNEFIDAFKNYINQF